MNIRKIAGTTTLILAAVTALACSGIEDPTEQERQANASSAPSGASVSAAPTSPKYDDLKPADIKLTVKILSKKCYDTAGCNVEFRISTLTYTKDLDPNATYEVTYKYTGLSDPVESTLTLGGVDGKFEVEAKEFGSTKRKDDRIAAVVTSVEKM